MMEEHVAVADGGEDLRAFQSGQRRRYGLHERTVLEVRPVDGARAPEAAEAERRTHLVDVGVVDLEVVGEDLPHARRHPLVDGDADDRAEAPPTDELLDGLEEVVGLQLLDGQLRVTGDPERV